MLTMSCGAAAGQPAATAPDTRAGAAPASSTAVTATPKPTPEPVKPTGNAGIDATIQTYYDVVAAGKSLGTSPAGQTIQSELNNAVSSALLGQKSPEQALADAQAASTRAYDKIVG